MFLYLVRGAGRLAAALAAYGAAPAGAGGSAESGAGGSAGEKEAAAPLRVLRTPAGQPYFPDRPGLHLSISHSGPWWACAIAGRPVGLDIEDPSIRRPGFPAARLAARYFTPAEQAYLAAEQHVASAPPSGGASALAAAAAGGPAHTVDGRAAFLALWTRKEALLKCRGTGIRGGLASFSVCDGTGLLARVTADRSYELFDLAALSGFAATGLAGALCLAEGQGGGAAAFAEAAPNGRLDLAAAGSERAEDGAHIWRLSDR